MLEFDLTYYQLVALLLLDLLRDPELIKHFISVLKATEIDDAREFHESMRISKEDRWGKTKQLSKERKFHLMNSCVPITCTLPFDGGMWRNSVKLMKVIPFFRQGLFRERTIDIDEEWLGIMENDRVMHPPRSMSIKQSIASVNYIYDNSSIGDSFRGGYSIRDIENCSEDLQGFEGKYEDAPYIKVLDSGTDYYIYGLYN